MCCIYKLQKYLTDIYKTIDYRVNINFDMLIEDENITKEEI